MEKAMRRIATGPDRTLRTALLWAGAIKLMIVLQTAQAAVVSYDVPTPDLIRKIEREQAWEQQQQHEMAVAAYRDARARQMEESIYQIDPVQPRMTRYRFVCRTEPKPRPLTPVRPLAQAPAPRPAPAPLPGSWDRPADPPGPPPLVPPSEAEVLARQREELVQHAERIEAEIRALHENTEMQHQEYDQRLRRIHEQIAGVDQELAELQRRRHERQQRLLAQAQEQTEQLSHQARDLQTQADRIQQTLGEMNRQEDIPSPSPPGPTPPQARPVPPVRPEPQPGPKNSPAADEATLKFREELFRELGDLRGANEHTNRMLEHLLYEDCDNPSTVGSAW